MTSQQLKMTTKNEIWSLSELFEKNTHIVKPKFNRDKVWIKKSSK